MLRSGAAAGKLVMLALLSGALVTAVFLLVRTRERKQLHQLEAELEQCRKDIQHTNSLELSPPAYVASRQALVRNMRQAEREIAAVRQHLYPRQQTTA